MSQNPYQSPQQLQQDDEPPGQRSRSALGNSVMWAVVILNFGLIVTVIVWQSGPTFSGPPWFLSLWCLAGTPITTGAASYYHALTTAATDSESHVKLFYFVSVSQLTAWGLYLILVLSVQ